MINCNEIVIERNVWYLITVIEFKITWKLISFFKWNLFYKIVNNYFLFLHILFLQLFFIFTYYLRIIIFEMKARLILRYYIGYLNLHEVRTLPQNTGRKISCGREQKSLFTERLLYIIIGATGRYAPVGNSRDPKYSAIVKIASSHSNCDRVLVAWIFICTRSSVARICLRKTRALLGSLYNVMSRCGIVAPDYGFSQRGTDLPAETNFAEPLEVFIKTTARRFPRA